MKRIKILMEKRLTPDIRDAEIDKIKKEISAEERKIWGQIKKRKRHARREQDGMSGLRAGALRHTRREQDGKSV